MLSLWNDAIPAPIASTRSATTRTRCLSANARMAVTSSILRSGCAIDEERASCDNLVAGPEAGQNFRLIVARAPDTYLAVSEAVVRAREPHMRLFALEDQGVFRDGGRDPVVTNVNPERRKHHRPEHPVRICESRAHDEPMCCRI